LQNGTRSAAVAIPANPSTSSVRHGGLCTSRSVAASTVTHVFSVPTSARATLNPFSGSS